MGPAALLLLLLPAMLSLGASRKLQASAAKSTEKSKNVQSA